MVTLSLLAAAKDGEEATVRPVLANLYAPDAAADFAAAVGRAVPQ